MPKTSVLSALCFLLVASFCLPVMAQEQDIFTDIAASPYRQAIIDLYQREIIQPSADGRFYPDRQLSRAEAAVLLVKGFHLPRITPIEATDPNLQKSYRYTDPLGVIDESFSIPSAKDIANHWGVSYMEGLIKVRADQVEGDTYGPNRPVTKAKWVEMIGKVIFGVDQPMDHAAKLVEMGLVSEEAAVSQEPISRAEAAGILHRILRDPDFQIVTIFATADIHSHLQPYKPSGMEREIGGLAKMSQIIKETRRSQPNLLLVDAGDAPYNTNIGNLFEGASTIDVMNQMGYDAMVLGNHDFDFPFQVLQRNAENAAFPFLSANTLYQGERPEFLHSSIVREVGGVKVGVIGVTDDQSIYYTHPKNVAGISFNDHFQAAQAEVEKRKDEVDIVLALAHLHGDNPVLPERVDGFDIVIGGGQDVVEYPQMINGAWLISPGKHAEVLNQINIQLYQGDRIGMNFAHIFMTDNLPEDPQVAQIVAEYESKMGEKMKQVVGETNVVLDGERQTVRLKESNLGNAIADSLRELTGADIALQNGGGIRASINQGEITMEEIYATLPFDNTVVMVEASGQTVWDALEHSVASYPAAAGGFLQVSGLSYTFDASKEPGQRLVEVLVDGSPIDKQKLYKVVANDFLTGGGDKFTMLKDETKLLVKTKHYLRDAFVEYLQKHQLIAPELEGRITIQNPEKATTE
ncbi:5'-nucleotidase C-terminal domain-containing protein [Brevibacillus humidisoli]|uniref:5'-nucleotidase C-terminal domain-containing protein n=1 Tax=Brevibacillus humidisoli TaxID=2895522 RepID=UPI001E5A3C9F|nr:5'-nucleotidase C-terminal domain-containing protein [Brevibacillus humidisoli]UFJ41168.1 5'-nucleotidase C-terminal domain-containing protein [Brevibacillus humidisoli]